MEKVGDSDVPNEFHSGKKAFFPGFFRSRFSMFFRLEKHCAPEFAYSALDWTRSRRILAKNGEFTRECPAKEFSAADRSADRTDELHGLIF